MTGVRVTREARRAQYEIPGFTAGIVCEGLERVLWLLDRHDERYGPNPLCAEMRRETRRELDRTRAWQAQARYLTDYGAACEAVEEEAR